MSEKIDRRDAEDAKEAQRFFARERLGEDTPAWEVVKRESVADCRVFQVRRDTSLHRLDNRAGQFYVLECPDWVNVIPITVNNGVVMIEQYRHGIGRVTLEIPGGMVDAGESPRDAALRELLEETNYAGDNVVNLGSTHPNPAIENNSIHTFLARDVRLSDKDKTFIHQDSSEHTTVRLVPLRDVGGLIREGVITHSLVVVAFHLLGLYEREVN
ncbi:MAG: NUDIX hydrolase [Pyrinomonadaceae bacterium MAG19_C2-C3]|nr:NUDIX hydrolase [Pyrinomonadaceae bacterium MAG19_C2-C3]